MKRSPTIQRYTEVVALLFKAPRTRKEIMCHASYANRESLACILRALKGEGLIYTADWQSTARGRPVEVFAWQPTVGAMPDALPPKAGGAA